MTVEFGENGHFAANLAPETMWIDFFFFLTGSSDVNSDSSDPDSASVAIRGVTIRYPHDTIRIAILESRYDTYRDTW